MSGLSVIVPLLNEYEALPSLVAHLDQIGAEQLIVVDGGSCDGSWQWFLDNWQNADRPPNQSRVLLQCEAGRARQMNLGAAQATQAILLFMHADTRLTAEAKSLICSLPTNEFWGRFDVRFESRRRGMSLIAFFMNLRSRISGIATGDQAIFVQRPLFDKVAGFDNLSLMEDVAISRKLRRVTKPLCVTEQVITSARRWEQHGLIRTVFKMWWYRLLFFFGVSPDRFINKYRDVR